MATNAKAKKDDKKVVKETPKEEKVLKQIGGKKIIEVKQEGAFYLLRDEDNSTYKLPKAEYEEKLMRA